MGRGFRHRGWHQEVPHSGAFFRPAEYTRQHVSGGALDEALDAMPSALRRLPGPEDTTKAAAGTR